MRFSIAGPALLLLAAGEIALAASATAADYFVRNLPGKPKDSLIKMHAGWVLSVGAAVVMGWW